MRNIIMLFIAVFSICSASGQNQIEIIKMKNKDNTVSISAINRSITAYEINLDVTLIGMTADKEFPYIFTLKPNQSESIVLLSPVGNAKERNYKIHYRAEPVLTMSDQLVYDVIEPNITIYTKNSQSRSTYINMYLKKNAIPFYEVNIDYNEGNKTRFNNMLKRRGLTETEVKFPVVIYRGEINYDIKDIEQFCDKHFKNRSKI